MAKLGPREKKGNLLKFTQKLMVELELKSRFISDSRTKCLPMILYMIFFLNPGAKK